MATRLIRPCWELVGSYAGFFTLIRTCAADQEIFELLAGSKQLWTELGQELRPPVYFRTHAEMDVATMVARSMLPTFPIAETAAETAARTCGDSRGKFLELVIAASPELVDQLLKQPWINHWHLLTLLRCRPRHAPKVCRYVQRKSREESHRTDFRLLKPLRVAARLSPRDAVTAILHALKPAYFATVMWVLKQDPYQYAMAKLAMNGATAMTPIQTVTALFADQTCGNGLGGYLGRIVAARINLALPATGELSEEVWKLARAVFECPVEHPNYHTDWLSGMIGRPAMASVAARLFSPLLVATWSCDYFEPTFCDLLCGINSFCSLSTNCDPRAIRWALTNPMVMASIASFTPDNKFHICGKCGDSIWDVTDLDGATPNQDSEYYSEHLVTILSCLHNRPDLFKHITKKYLVDSAVKGMARHWFPYIDELAGTVFHAPLLRGAIRDTNCSAYHPFLDRIVATMDPTTVTDEISRAATMSTIEPAAAIWITQRFKLGKPAARMLHIRMSNFSIVCDQAQFRDCFNAPRLDKLPRHYHPRGDGTFVRETCFALSDFDPDDSLSCLRRLRTIMTEVSHDTRANKNRG